MDLEKRTAVFQKVDFKGETEVPCDCAHPFVSKIESPTATKYE